MQNSAPHSGKAPKVPKEDPVTEGVKSILNKAKDAVSLTAEKSSKDVPGSIMGKIQEVVGKPSEKNEAYDGKAPKDGEGSLDPTTPMQNSAAHSGKAPVVPKEDPVTEGVKSILNKAKDAVSLTAEKSSKDVPGSIMGKIQEVV